MSRSVLAVIFGLVLSLQSILVLGAYTCVVSSNTIGNHSFLPPQPAVDMKANPATGMVEFAVTVPYIKNALVSVGFWPVQDLLDYQADIPACSNREVPKSNYPGSLHAAVAGAPATAHDLPSDSFAYPAGTNAGAWIRETTTCHTVTYRTSLSIAELSEQCSRNGIPSIYMRSVSATKTVTYGGSLRVAYDWVDDPTNIVSDVHRASYDIEFEIKMKPSLKYVSALSSTDFLATSEFSIKDMSLTVDTMGRAFVELDIEAVEGNASLCEPIALGVPQEIDFKELSCSCDERCDDVHDGSTHIEFHTVDTVRTLASDDGWTLGLTKMENPCGESCSQGPIQGIRFGVYFEDTIGFNVTKDENTFSYGRAAIGSGDKLQFLLTDMSGYGKKIQGVHICAPEDIQASSGPLTPEAITALLSVCPKANVSDGMNSSLVTMTATPEVGLGLVTDEAGVTHPIPYVKSSLPTVRSYDDWTSGHLEDEEPPVVEDPTDGNTDDDDYEPVTPGPKTSNGAVRPTLKLLATGMVVAVVSFLI